MLNSEIGTIIYNFHFGINLITKYADVNCVNRADKIE